jgi:hypothetical protein
MSRPTIPSPSSSTVALFNQLDAALAAFTDARSRREEAESRVRSGRFELKELTDEPPPINNLRAQAEREQAIARAKARVDEALGEFLAAQRALEQIAIEATRAGRAASAAVQREVCTTVLPPKAEVDLRVSYVAPPSRPRRLGPRSPISAVSEVRPLRQPARYRGIWDRRARHGLI